MKKTFKIGNYVSCPTLGYTGYVKAFSGDQIFIDRGDVYSGWVDAELCIKVTHPTETRLEFFNIEVPIREVTAGRVIQHVEFTEGGKIPTYRFSHIAGFGSNSMKEVIIKTDDIQTYHPTNLILL